MKTFGTWRRGEFARLSLDDRAIAPYSADLARLPRDNYLVLSLMAELHFNGVCVVSVADGLDTGDEEAKLGIQLHRPEA